MARHRLRAEWEQTSVLITTLANCIEHAVKPLGRAWGVRYPINTYRAEDFNPFVERRHRRGGRGIPLTADNIDLLLVLVPRDKRPNRKPA